MEGKFMVLVNKCMDRLSEEQKAIILPLMEEWRLLVKNEGFHFSLTRNPIGIIPSWYLWSTSQWVRWQSNRFTPNQDEIHISYMPHLALPPIKEPNVSYILERECKRKYGHWKTETEWVPPMNINGTGVWVKRNSC